MDTFYPTKHWLLTIVTGPVVLYLYSLIFWGADSLVDLISFYIIFILFGFFFSLPAFICYYLLFYAVKRKVQSPLRLKTILNAIAIASILITFLLLRGSAVFGFIISYSIAVVICSGFTSIKKEDINTTYRVE